MAGLPVAILIVCWLGLMVVGLRQWRRRRRLGQFALQCGLRFSWRDPFGLIQRYGACQLLQAGHSAQVDGVLFGRYSDWNVRLFDLGFEVGHGPNRSVRRYTVIAAELPDPVAMTFAWRDGPDELGVSVLTAGARAIDDRWSYAGDQAIADMIRNAWPEGASESIGVETLERLAVFATADPMDPPAMRRQLDAVVGCLAPLAAAGQTEHCNRRQSVLQERQP